jgi:T3SS negative regulator,GrlR
MFMATVATEGPLRAGAEAAVIPAHWSEQGSGTVSVAEGPGSQANAEIEAPVRDGLYTLGIEMSGAKRGHATGVVVLRGGVIMGGDSFFYYTGSYSHSRGKWRGEMIVHQHTEAPGLNLEGTADIDGTALVGSYSIPFRARLTLKVVA